MGFFSKAFKTVKKVAKVAIRAGLAVATGGASEVLYAGKKAMDAQSDALKDLGRGLNREGDPTPDYASAESRASIYERRKRRTGQASGRSSTILGGSTLGSLAPTSSGSYARRKLLGGA